MRVRLFVVAGLIAFAWLPTARAGEVLREISWTKLKKAGVTLPGEILPTEPSAQGEILKIENPEDKSREVTLLELNNPGITRASYAIRGAVRYETMQGMSYLEMWGRFPDGKSYFSRTLSQMGPMKHLEGSSDWREFSLPFLIGKSKNRPDRLVVNVVFKGSGTVYLGPLQLEQYVHPDEATMPSGAWWGDRMGGWIGALLGTVFGCLGGLIGLLAGRGRARGLVMGLTAAILAVGLALLAVGAVAWLLGQPYAVWYPLALGGGIMTIVVGPMRKTIRRRYEQAELQRMAAMDLGGRGA